ncbi:S9 family peptidase [Schaalia sp. lx-260]|uniref:S9 family peptidase n=1 Tax=Schaalia sp. lx-260 TaxID=2899082 RepID=UPI001E2C65BB|nr:prolyl oligopeptidase family serine peptidase [Schaalia sp. lx-260]MCD4550013.1 prolyl oligopeptidase family serine peptidase [Schaalia sp. lx-260]
MTLSHSFTAEHQPIQVHPHNAAHPPQARKKTGYRVRDIHGDHFDDPWDWLRDKNNPEVIAHMAAENTWTDHVCAPIRDFSDRIANEIRSFTVLTDATVPIRYGHYWWFSRWNKNQQYRTHYRLYASAHQDRPPQIDAHCVGAQEELVLDENAHSFGHEYFRLGELIPSPCGRFVAWSCDTSGDERWDWTIHELSTGRVIDTTITGTGTGFAWSSDSSACIYTRVDHAWRQHEVWVHTVGDQAQTDRVLLHEDDEGFDLWFSPSPDPAHVAIHATSPTTGQAWLWYTDHPYTPPLCITPREKDVMVTVEPAGDHLVLVHTRHNQEGTVALAPLPMAQPAGHTQNTRPFASPDTWVTLREAGAGERILDVEAYRDFLVLSLRSGSLPHVEYCQRLSPPQVKKGHRLQDIWGQWTRISTDSPVRTLMPSHCGPFDTRSLRIAHHSITVPPTWELITPSTGERVHLKTLEVPHWDPSDFVEQRVWVQARDGKTRIPVTIVYPKDATPDGSHAAWLHGYGAYEVSFDAEFDTGLLPALTRGVIHVIAHVRGGGECGRAWYEDGKKSSKIHSFTDFLDVAQWLIDTGWAHPDRLIAQGRSAGGLLMGAVMNEAPQLFRVVLAGVPFVDALTTILDASLPLTSGEWEEWGNPITDRHIYELMRAYSPYENVRDRVAYPALMATTSMNDTRVFFVEPAKWVQRIREATISDPLLSPVVLRTEMVAGHGGPSAREERWKARGEESSFALSLVGIRH